MQQAKTDKIPVIAFDSGVDSDVPVCTASTDNLAAAAEAAKHMAELIGHEGKIAMVVHDQTSVTGVQRRDGFVNYMKKNEPKITDRRHPVQRRPAQGDRPGQGDHRRATRTSRACTVPTRAPPSASSTRVQELGITGKLKIVGFDSGKDQIDAIKSGLMAGAITQNPVGIGYETVKAAVAVIKGQSVPKTIDTGFYWYDKTNIADTEDHGGAVPVAVREVGSPAALGRAAGLPTFTGTGGSLRGCACSR